jgi:amidohydrolase
MKMTNLIQKHRRYLHQYPELSGQEKNTAHYCKTIFGKLGYKVKDCWGYGFIADLDIANSNKRIAFRADMDALPIQEKNTHEFVSKNPGVAHMCGHDVHMAIALATAELLKQRAKKLKCSIRFIFQPKEEEIPGGALGMIENGCLDGVDEIYGLHNHPLLPLGVVATRVGTLTAGCATFDLTIKGKGCHAAHPKDGLSPIPAASFLINEWQAIPKKIDPRQPPILSITKCVSGNTFNIIPDIAQMSGTVRVLEQHYLAEIKALMDKTIAKLEEQGYQCEFNYEFGYECVVNHAYGVERIVKAAQTVINKDQVDSNVELYMYSEDFCYYLQKVPGAFYSLGGGNKNITEPLHSPYFDIDEEMIPIGAAIMAEIAIQGG